jgi:hypothetical protein
MKEIIIPIIIIFLWFKPMVAFCDPSTTLAVLEQTTTQTAEHLKDLEQMVQQVELLQSQLSSMNNLLTIAQNNSAGVDGMSEITNFQNTVLSTNQLIQNVQGLINTSQDVSSQWKTLFGSLDSYVANSNQVFGNINASDQVNSSGYLIADSYQNLYQQNSDYVRQFVANANNVSEKGALKQIALEVAQLIQMENNMTYLLAQVVKTQSIESSNANLNRKQDAANFEQENQGVKDFMGTVDDQTFKT